MKILVINSGSSSIKYQLVDMDGEKVMAKGLAERIGITGSRLKHKRNSEEFVIETAIPTHKEGLKLIMDTLVSEDKGVIKSFDEISAIGHRVVHAGEAFAGSVRINDEVMKSLKDCIKLAPLHNPPNIMGIEAAMELMPNVPEVGVFDTAFHVRSLPKHAYLYAIPYKYYEKYKIRRYGFHGTSHKYVSTEAAKMIGKPIEELKIITCHLGNGASVAAIDGGRSIDTTMGFTPLEGLYMGTRSGDLDPAILIYLMDEEGLTSQEIYNLLNKQSGMLGVTGMTSDMRDIEDAALEGNERAKLALDMYSYKIKKYVGAYAAALGGLDAIVFTGGIGENSDIVRRDVCKSLKFMGVKIDDSKNDGLRGKKVDISAQDSKVKVLVIPTNEEIVIARDTKEIVEKNLDIL